VHVLFYVVGGLAVAAWLGAAISAAAMVQYRAPNVSFFYLMTHGHAFWTGSAFTEEAQPHRRRFLLCGVVFFLCIINLGVLAATTGV
jgi:hypothetical protein